MLNRRSFLASFASTLALLASWRPAWAQATHSANVTFVLVNDIYLMGEQPFPDGKTRGGFARLAAVVKAERERARPKGRTVIVAHGGDTLSPSVMSGLDRGAHIIALTNMIAPDIFVPGNHEFDFGKAVFLERMARGEVPALWREFPRCRRRAAAAASRTARWSRVGGVRIGLTGHRLRAIAAHVVAGGSALWPTIDDHQGAGRSAAAEGADFVCAVLHCNRGDGDRAAIRAAAELLLTGHTHDLFVNHDGKCALVESGYDAHYVTCVDVAISVREDGGKRVMTWWPQFRVIDTATVTPDPEVAAAVARFEAALLDKMSEAICTTAVALDSPTATVRTREAAIGNLFADAMRVGMHADAAMINGGGIRAGKSYEPGARITQGDILAELPFNNRVVVVEIAGARLAARDGERACRSCPARPGASRRCPASRSRSISRASRAAASPPCRSPARRSTRDKTYRVAVLDFLARGGDDYTMFRDAKRITPDNDAPLLVNEVMGYLRKIGTVRTGVEGRIAAK